MALDVECYRRTIYLPIGAHAKRTGGASLNPSYRRLSVIDIDPEGLLPADQGAWPTLLFIHGYGGNALQWIHQLRFFGQSMRVIAPDWRGHGLSDDPQGLAYSMESLVDDVELLIDELHVQKPLYVIGHSFGGAIASEYTLRHPANVRGLVLLGVPTRFLLHPIARRLLNVPDPIFSFLAKRLKIALHAPQHTLKHIHDSVMSAWRGDERMQHLRVPTLIVLGQRDSVFLRQHYEDVSRSIPGAQNVVIPVSAHLVQLERPDAVNRVIRRLITPKPAITPSPHISRLFEMPWLHHYDSDVPEQVPLPKQLLHDMLTSAAQVYPNRPAIIFFGQKISYRELDALSNRFAHALRQLGVQKADRVGIVLPNIPQCIIAFYGTLKAGGAVVLGSPLSHEEEIAYQLRDSGATVLLTLSSYRHTIEQLCANTSVKHIIYTTPSEYLPLRQRFQLTRLIDNPDQWVSRSNLIPSLLSGQALSGNEGPERSEGEAERLSILLPSAHSPISYHSFQHLLRSQPTTPNVIPTNTVNHDNTVDHGNTVNPTNTVDHGNTVILSEAKDLALLQYTSGTSDSPKGVMLTHRNLIVNVVQVRHWIPDARRGHEVILCALPLSHSYSITDCMNLSIALAASIVLLPTTRPNEILETIKRSHPTIFPGVPALFLAIANHPKVRSYGIASIRICVSGSAPLPVEVQEAFEKLTRGRLIEGYGLTEASPVTHSNPLKGERRIGSIGIPLPSTHARIIDWKTGQPLPIGEVGELLIRGPQVMQGYWNMPAETAQALQDGWLHTGDLASMDEDGFFTIVDRKKDLILSGPHNVYPRDIEEILYEHPKVLEAAVVAAHAPTSTGPVIPRSPTINRGATQHDPEPAIPRPTEHDPGSVILSEAKDLRTGHQETLEARAKDDKPFMKAVVVLKRGEKATADELLAFCRERLDAYKVPQQIEFRPELPKNFVGKVLRRLLVES